MDLARHPLSPVHTFTVLVIACCLLRAPSDRDVAAGQRGTALTAMDDIEIQQLVNRLNFALDYCTQTTHKRRVDRTFAA